MVSHDAWKNLPFLGFDEGQLRYRPLWEKAARDILELEARGERVGLIAETGAGKTIIALLAVIADKKRTLFLTTKRILTGQHGRLLLNMTGGFIESRTINGETKHADRIWNNEEELVVFSTPQIVRHELKYFQRIVIDEFHRAVRNYSYVELVKRALGQNLAILALSASPASDREKLETVMRNCGITYHLRVDRPDSPKRFEDLVIAEPDETLRKVDDLFAELFLEALRELKEIFACLGHELKAEKGYIPESEIQAAEKHISTLTRKTDKYFEAISLIAKYKKLRHAHKVVMTESYETFEAYVRERISDDESRSAKAIRESGAFKTILGLVRDRSVEHPKVAKCIEVVSSMHRTSRRGLIFFEFKVTASCLEKKLGEAGFRKIKTLFGGKDRSVDRQKEVIEQLKAGEINFILATSVLEEGIAVPEVDVVIHYSMPASPISRIQRSGRTARVRNGNVVYITLNHFLDWARYSRSKSGVRKMNELVGGQPVLPARPRTVRPRTVPQRERRAHDGQLSLAFTLHP